MKSKTQIIQKKEAGFVAAEVKKYFTWQGNRCVFRNGLSMNKVADAMKDLCGDKVDAGLISHTVNCERQFSPAVADAFCKVVGLDMTERLLLFSALAKDKLHRADMDVAIVALAPTINLVIKDLHRVDEAIAQDLVAQAISILHEVFQWQGELGNEASDSSYLIRIHTLGSIEREKVIQKIAQRQQSVNLDIFELVNRGLVVEIAGMFEPESHQQLLKEIIEPPLSLSPLERDVWNSIYRQKKSVSETAEQLFLHPGTVLSIREHIEQRLIVKLARQIGAAF